MLHTYRMREDIRFDEVGQKYIVYGIDAIDADGTVLMSFPDVFFDGQKAERFVTLCNEGELSLLHLADAVEDALVEQYTVDG